MALVRDSNFRSRDVVAKAARMYFLDGRSLEEEPR